ncbi:hypothetical protein, partial [Agathobacter rectalis]|uniref:hypothetical protein n=1 Tax=Agathobacter rectalis TaxID=39491 RepID=UPI0027D29649
EESGGKISFRDTSYQKIILFFYTRKYSRWMLLITSSCELKKVAEKIAIMKKEIHLHLDEEVANQIDEMCNHVYKGNCFDNIRLNEFVQNLQYILV